MIAYKYPITDHLGPGPLVASKLRDDTSCLVNSSSNGKTGFYFIKVIPPNDEPDPKGSSLHIFPLPSITCLCNIFILLLIDVVFVNWDLLMMYSEQICHPALDWIQRTHCKTHVLEWMKQAKNQKKCAVWMVSEVVYILHRLQNNTNILISWGWNIPMFNLVNLDFKWMIFKVFSLFCKALFPHC